MDDWPRLGELPPTTDEAWATFVDGLPGARDDVVVPAAIGLPALLLDLAVPHEDVDLVVAARRGLSDGDEEVVRRIATLVVERIGEVGPCPLRHPPSSLGPLRDWLPVLVFVTAVEHTRAFHHAHDVPDGISWATLRDLGRQLAVQRWAGGRPGLADVGTWWLWLHLTGVLFQLGRLQLERTRLGRRTGEGILAAGGGAGQQAPALSVHIPRWSGPFDPAACDASLARASFITDRWPDTPTTVFICSSWLMDPQLADVLPSTSNIVRFQRRFRLAYDPKVDDDGPLRFVFGNAARAATPTTTLEKALVDHLAAGGHWHLGMGWAPIGDPTS